MNNYYDIDDAIEIIDKIVKLNTSPEQYKRIIEEIKMELDDI